MKWWKPLFVISTLTSTVVSAPILLGRQDGIIRTTFLIDDSCGNNKSVIQKAHDDAARITFEAIDDDHEELSTLVRYTINWDGEAAMDYFGPPSMNSGYREHILRTIVQASQSIRGWGLSDWWYGNYVTITCNDPYSKCKPTSPAYTSNRLTQKYPLINYCPPFFEELKPHDEMWNKIETGAADMKQNVRNLRSQATTALHELLHINSNWISNACAGGCKRYLALCLHLVLMCRC